VPSWTRRGQRSLIDSTNRRLLSAPPVPGILSCRKQRSDTRAAATPQPTRAVRPAVVVRLLVGPYRSAEGRMPTCSLLWRSRHHGADDGDMIDFPNPEHVLTPIQQVPEEERADQRKSTPRSEVPGAPPSPVPTFRGVPGADEKEAGRGEDGAPGPTSAAPSPLGL